jgi:hypothetical protein
MGLKIMSCRASIIGASLEIGARELRGGRSCGAYCAGPLRTKRQEPKND